MDNQPGGEQEQEILRLHFSAAQPQQLETARHYAASYKRDVERYSQVNFCQQYLLNFLSLNTFFTFHILLFIFYRHLVYLSQ